MNLIITDFDGTFFDDNYLKNIDFIESIKNNYEFVIATGRSFEVLKKDLKIKCKYYICNDGGYILDSNEKLIYNNFIDNDVIKIIYNRMKELDYKDYFFDYIDYFDTRIEKNINKLSIQIRDDNALADIDYILKDLNGVYGYLSDNWINIISTQSRKEYAIDKILEFNNYERIYVVGNEINDYGMLKKYSGYLISKEKIDGYKTINNFLELEKELNLK